MVNDAFTPIRAGSDRGWGVALICGQGVNAAGIAPDGRTARLAALGDISGDWGGGHDIGTAALGAAVRARDGRGPRTDAGDAGAGPLRRRAADRRHPPDRGGDPRRTDGSPSCRRSSSRRPGPGDAVARSILDRQADELVAMARAIIRRLHLTRLDPDGRAGRGVFESRDATFDARIVDGIRAIAPGATVRRSEALPVLGAALLGLDRTLGRAIRGAMPRPSTRLRASLGEWRPA